MVIASRGSKDLAHTHVCACDCPRTVFKGKDVLDVIIGLAVDLVRSIDVDLGRIVGGQGIGSIEVPNVLYACQVGVDVLPEALLL